MQEEWKQIMMEGTDEEREILRLALQAIKQKRERNSAYLSGFLGLQGAFIDERTYQFEVPITPYMHNSLKIVHGGVTATLIDNTMGSLINKVMAKEGKAAVTSDLQIRYLRPGKGQKLKSVAKLIHRGGLMAVMEGSVYDDQDRLIAHGTGTFVIIDRGRI
ncbi:PaaI family thioesterase [Brevibacillus laterosporus]|uniref:PaaI family thioesterase n=1 Tax=Brevibacillus laterosporus TaxID=1465 RepID=UPI0035A59DFF